MCSSASCYRIQKTFSSQRTSPLLQPHVELWSSEEVVSLDLVDFKEMILALQWSLSWVENSLRLGCGDQFFVGTHEKRHRSQTIILTLNFIFPQKWPLITTSIPALLRFELQKAKERWDRGCSSTWKVADLITICENQWLPSHNNTCMEKQLTKALNLWRTKRRLTYDRLHPFRLKMEKQRQEHRNIFQLWICMFRSPSGYHGS